MNHEYRLEDEKPRNIGGLDLQSWMILGEMLLELSGLAVRASDWSTNEGIVFVSRNIFLKVNLAHLLLKKTILGKTLAIVEWFKVELELTD